MKKSPHRFFFSVHVLSLPLLIFAIPAPTRAQGWQHWIELACGGVPVKLPSENPHLQTFSESNRDHRADTDPDRCMSGWLHSQRNPQHKGHELQNGCTLVVAFSPHCQKKKEESLCWFLIQLPFSTALSSSFFYFFLLAFNSQPITCLCYQHAI